MAELPREHVVKIRAELGNAAVVRPGDRLVVSVRRPLAPDEGTRLKEKIEERLPGVDVVLLDGSLCVEAVYRDSETITYSDCTHPALQAIRDRLEQSDEALSAAWLRGVIAGREG